MCNGKIEFLAFQVYNRSDVYNDTTTVGSILYIYIYCTFVYYSFLFRHVSISKEHTIPNDDRHDDDDTDNVRHINQKRYCWKIIFKIGKKCIILLHVHLNVCVCVCLSFHACMCEYTHKIVWF